MSPDLAGEVTPLAHVSWKVREYSPLYATVRRDWDISQGLSCSSVAIREILHWRGSTALRHLAKMPKWNRQMTDFVRRVGLVLIMALDLFRSAWLF